MKLSSRDQAQLENLGISIPQYHRQLKQIEEGVPFMNLDRPATIGDGITRLEDVKKYLEIFSKRSDRYNLQKFVPASGAASRMFKSLYVFLDTFEPSNSFEKYSSEYPDIK
ncbi:MAG: DUF4301 family protein, partial [Flavobacteriaceae bacterium]